MERLNNYQMDHINLVIVSMNINYFSLSFCFFLLFYNRNSTPFTNHLLIYRIIFLSFFSYLLLSNLYFKKNEQQQSTTTKYKSKQCIE